MANIMLISVVIPIYNAEKTLVRTVESVLPQIGEQVELILVDDGSVDGSGRMCDEYSQNNPHIHTIHQINGGSSAARNTGIRAAAGEYIMFLDADDYFDPNACKLVANVINQHHPDCIDFGWNYVNGTGEISANHHAVPKNVLLDNDVLRETIIPPLLNLCPRNDYFVCDFACMKVFRRQIIEQYAVSFDEGRRTWEDRLFVIQYLKHCQNYYSIDQCLYYYVFTEGSLSQRYTPDYFRIILDSFRQCKGLYDDEYDFSIQYVSDHWSGAIENMIYRSLAQEQNTDVIRQNILNTLQDPQVIHWYATKSPGKAFDEKIRGLVVAGDVEAALTAYSKKEACNRRLQKWLQVNNRIKGAIRKLIGK